MHIHYSEYTHGDTVYLKTDIEQHPRMVVAITIRPGGIAYYELAFSADSSFHFDIEMSKEPDEKIRLGLKQADQA